jgi:hypothetical protein
LSKQRLLDVCMSWCCQCFLRTKQLLSYQLLTLIFSKLTDFGQSSENNRFETPKNRIKIMGIYIYDMRKKASIYNFVTHRFDKAASIWTKLAFCIAETKGATVTTTSKIICTYS